MCVFSSRESGKKYVRHLLWKDRNEIAQLHRDGARFYTCGSAKKLDVSAVTCFIKIILQVKQDSEEETEKILEKISLDKYGLDVFP